LADEPFEILRRAPNRRPSDILRFLPGSAGGRFISAAHGVAHRDGPLQRSEEALVVEVHVGDGQKESFDEELVALAGHGTEPGGA